METLTNCENPSSNPLQIACCDIQEAACDFVNCSVSWEACYGITFRNTRRTIDWRIFSKDELRFTIPFELSCWEGGGVL